MFIAEPYVFKLHNSVGPKLSQNPPGLSPITIKSPFSNTCGYAAKCIMNTEDWKQVGTVH